MPLSRGARLGAFEVVDLLGAGGMGEVYRAHDTRLGREVAIKVLPATARADPERLHRFEQEARAAGQLNHPNIVAVHDVGEHEGSPYVVSELLEGVTLRERLLAGPLPLPRAIDLAIQMASGLAAAHRKGIVHRDLKPENLFVTRDGHLKILDFGLAKLMQHDGSPVADAHALTGVAFSEPGQILGTVGYMSPEQVRGQPTDLRSDIFSAGAVLFEMLSGERAFRGESPVDTLSGILRADPPDLPRTDALIPAMNRIVRRCLEKNRDDRFQSASDLRFALESVVGSPSTTTVTEPAAPTRPSTAGPSRRRPLLVGTAGLAVAIATFAAGWWTAPGRRNPANQDAPSYQALTFRRGTVMSARFAPDGRTVIYSAAWDGGPFELYATRVDSPESRPLDIPGGDILSISPSGELAILTDCRFRLGRGCEGTLARVPVVGGTPRELLEDVYQADWSPDGKQLAVARRTANGFRLEYPLGHVLTEAVWVGHPRVSPAGDRVAFFERQRGELNTLSVVDASGRKTQLAKGVGAAYGLAWAPAGDEIWFSRAKGSPFAIFAVTLSGQLRMVARVPGALRLHDISRDNRVLASRDTYGSGIIARAPGESRERDLSQFTNSSLCGLSRDGRAVLFTDHPTADDPPSTGPAGLGVYVRTTDGSPAVRLADGLALALSPDGKWALTTTVDRLDLVPTGPGETRTLARGPIERYGTDSPASTGAVWLPDGERVIFTASEPGHRWRSYIQDLRGGAARAVTPEGVYASLVSPDGRLMVGVDEADNRAAIYPVDGGPARPIAGLGPGETPLQWSADGRFLYVRQAGPYPLRLFRLALLTAKRDAWKELMPPDPAGVRDVGGPQVTPDGTSYAFEYLRIVSELYLIDRLK